MHEALDVTKATGSDKNQAKLLKETTSVCNCTISCKLLKKSLSTGSFPQNYKEANVVPVFKKGEAKSLENYRPISLPSLVSKVLERCVFNTSNKDSLEGNHAPPTFLDYVGSPMDHGKQVDMIYMDMSKTFVKVNHGCLLQKFHEFGFGGSLLQWFSSYLMVRYQRVTVLGETSDTLPVSSGIPQGSILGPMLFIIYVNNLPDSVLTSHVAMHVC